MTDEDSIIYDPDAVTQEDVDKMGAFIDHLWKNRLEKAECLISTYEYLDMYSGYGNIMTCRWSVPTKDTVNMMDKIYDNLLKKKMSFGEALLMAQREMKDDGKNQLSWAGIECWVN